VREYFQVGVARVWLVVPNLQQIHIYTSLNTIQVVERSGTLDAEPLLPGFGLPLSDLFEQPAQEV
jgi:Uma2 family endonuclease